VLFGAGQVMASQDVKSELAEMRGLVNQLQQQVTAQDEQLQAQGQQLDEAQAVVLRAQEDVSAVSGLSSFLNSVEIDGWVAGSYAYNTNEPNDSAGGGGLNQGIPVPGNSYLPFHGDHNNFQVDQVWFGMGKTASEDSRAGFRIDTVYGATAAALGSTGGGLNDSASDLYVYQAYVEYLAPIGDGVNLKLGKFATLAGAEVAQTTQNFNITRGILYNSFQPITHTGVLATTNVGPLSVSLGLANSTVNAIQQPDNNSEKTYIVNAGYSQDNVGISATVIYGAELPANNHDRSGLFDLVLTYDHSDELSTWLNFDYAWSADSAPGESDDSSWGVAAAGRLAINDSTGIAARLEYANSNDTLPMRVETWGITATVDHMLTDNLMVRGEVRYDDAHTRVDGGRLFDDNDSDQTVLIAQMVYTF